MSRFCSGKLATKLHAIVSGQTSVKAPEKQAFEKYLPEDVYIVSVHSLHGPSVTTEGQPLVSGPRGLGGLLKGGGAGEESNVTWLFFNQPVQETRRSPS